jgi:hypothetical protein
MLRPLPEEQQGLPDHNFHPLQEEARMAETRLRRKMVVNPKRRAATPAANPQPNSIASAVRFSSPLNLVFAVLSSATFGWVLSNWHGR